MERDLAKHVVSAAFKSMGDLTDLLALLKNHCDEAEYAAYVRAIAAVCTEISSQILHKVFEEHPGLEDEVGDKVKKYGKFI